jgi:cell division protein FtsB
MSPRADRRPAADPEPDAADDARPAGTMGAVTPAATAALGSLADLPVAGLTRRRIGLLIAAIVAAWIIVLFARQVSEASDATARADAARAANTALAAEVAGLEQELQLIQRDAYVSQQARTYRLGTTKEIPFTLADGAPTLAPDAPGSASVRLGAVTEQRSPLDAWLDLLFGSAAATRR